MTAIHLRRGSNVRFESPPAMHLSAENRVRFAAEPLFIFGIPIPFSRPIIS